MNLDTTLSKYLPWYVNYKKPFFYAIFIIIIIAIVANLFKKVGNIVSLKAYKAMSYKQALAYANMFHTAMKDVGTDENALQTLYNELSIIPNGFQDVYTAFGKRKYSLFGSSLIGDDDDLMQWINHEVSGELKEKFNALYLKFEW